jgi:hypothetical protein
MYRLSVLLMICLAVGACSSGNNAECEEGQGSCSEDSLVLTICQEGKWQTIDCMAEQGRLCEAGACIEPARFGSPDWGRCETDPLATPESLHAKMIYYEDIAARLHIHPVLKWIAGVILPCDGADCTTPGVAEDQATYNDVEQWMSGENDGLWSALYLAAEAFRYGTTKDEEALANIKLLLDGEKDRLAITGVPGVFTRQLIPPGVAGINCPTDPVEYIPDVEKDDNQWVRVGSGGCVEVTDSQTLEWVTTEHCGLDQYAGYCWLDNVSQDEYAGHMFALGAVYKLVDDPEVQATVREMLLQIGTHLVDNRLEIHDWDGRPVEHGRLYAMALDNFLGFNAAMALDYIKICAVATGDDDIQEFFDDCLLQKHGLLDCIQQPAESPMPYTEHLTNSGLYVGVDSCMSNWNNISMHFASLHNLIWFETDPELRAKYQYHLQHEAFDPPDTPRPVVEQNNTWFNFIYASQKALGPDTDGPALAAVENGICMLRQFPASQRQATVECPPAKCQFSCSDRLDHDIGDYPRQIAERCPGTFVWWGNPYDLRGCTEDKRRIRPPTGYLLAYWMGRYYGFISEDM